MTTSMALRLIALAWVLPMMITLMPLCWKDLKWSSPAAQDASNSTFDGAERANQIYLGIVLVLFEILPCIVILLTFTRLYFVVRNQSRRIKALEIAIRFNLDIRTQRKRKIERSTVNAFFAVIIMFEICWVLSAYRAFCSYYNVCTISLLFVQTSRLFLFFNSVVNFFVYALLKSDIRDEIKQLIRFWSKVSVGTVTIQKEKQRTLLSKKPNQTSTKPSCASVRKRSYLASCTKCFNYRKIIRRRRLIAPTYAQKKLGGAWSNKLIQVHY